MEEIKETGMGEDELSTMGPGEMSSGALAESVVVPEGK